MNLWLMGRDPTYVGAPTDPNVPRIPLVELDTNGYPTSIPAGVTQFQVLIDDMPTVAQYPGIYVMDWVGNGTMARGAMFANAPGYTSANLTSSTGSGRYEFTRTVETSVGGIPNFGISATSAAPNYIRSVRIYRKVDEAMLNGGQIFGQDYLAAMIEASPGWIRSLGIVGSSVNGTNQCNMALWSHRKPVAYRSWKAMEYRVSQYAGRTTSNGNDYSITWAGFAGTDKELIHVLFDATSFYDSTTVGTITAGNPGTITFAASANHVQVGNAICLAHNSGALPSPLTAGGFVYVQSIVDAAAGIYQIAATRGGAALNISGSLSSVRMATIPMINFNGTGFRPITPQQYPSNIIAFVGSSTQAPGANLVGTLVWDATTGFFAQTGGNVSLSNAGINSGFPPEVFVNFCARVGAHPWIVAPYLSLETAASVHAVTDFMPSWMSYIKASGSPWMKPPIEPVNELWNPGSAFFGTYYARGVSWARWAYNANIDGQNNVYGKWVSTLGQAAALVWPTGSGSPDPGNRTKYSVVCAFQTVSLYTASSPTWGGNVARYDATLYQSQNGGRPAYNWLDRLCGAPYYSPSQRYTVSDLQLGFDICVTYAGNTAQQNATADTYVDGANNSSANTPYTLPYVNQCFVNMKALAVALPGGNTCKGFVTYEGAYSPDYLSGDWSMGITSATAANPCVLTVAATCTNPEAAGSFTITGSPAKVGMVVIPSGVSTMTQLNNGLTSGSLTFTGGGSANIVGTNSFSVGDAIAFNNTNVNNLPMTTALPPEVAIGKAYYVVSSGNPFQVSATKGGAAIAFATAWIVGNNVATRGFAVTAVSATTITLDFDASALSPGTGGTCTFAASQMLSNTLRCLGRFSAHLGTVNTQMYSNYFALSDGTYTAEAVSNFIYFAPGNVWAILDTIYSTRTAQWNSMVAANHP